MSSSSDKSVYRVNHDDINLYRLVNINYFDTIQNVKYLNSGTYGCVFVPSLYSISSQNDHHPSISYVSKIFKNDTLIKSRQFYKDEKDGMDLMSEIDDDRKFTLNYEILAYLDIKTNTWKKLEKINPMVINFNQPDQNNCKLINMKNEAYFLNIEYGGIQFTDIIVNNFFLILHSFKELIIGIKNMNKYLIHRDIKPDNILVNLNTNKISLIDFGVQIDRDSAFKICSLDRLQWQYPIYPPEFTIIAYMYTYNYTLPEQIDDEFIKFCFRNIENFHLPILNKYIFFMINDLLDVINDVKSNNLNSEKKICNYFDASKIDLYSIAISFMWKIGMQENIIDRDEILETLFMNMIRPNFQKRFGADDVINYINKLINQQGGKNEILLKDNVIRMDSKSRLKSKSVVLHSKIENEFENEFKTWTTEKKITLATFIKSLNLFQNFKIKDFINETNYNKFMKKCELLILKNKNKIDINNPQQFSCNAFKESIAPLINKKGTGKLNNISKITDLKTDRVRRREIFTKIKKSLHS